MQYVHFYEQQLIHTKPQERFLGFERRSVLGRALPSWLIQPGPLLLHRFVRNKNDPLVEEVELLKANQSIAHFRFSSGRESSVSSSDLIPTSRKNMTEVTKETVPIQRTTQLASVSTNHTNCFSTKFSRQFCCHFSIFLVTPGLDQPQKYSNSSELETSS